MSQLKLEYLLFVFVASCGTLQLVAAISKLKGLLFFHKEITGYILAALTIGGAFGWFFAWDNRLQEKIMRTGLEGAQQFYYFILAAFSAVAFTLIISSVVNLISALVASLWKGERDSGRAKRSTETRFGLDALREMTYLEAIWRSIGKKYQKWAE